MLFLRIPRGKWGKATQMEFTPIETQEQFDAMVKERVERAKKSAAKEFETQLKDLEGIKEQLTSKDSEIEALKAKITDFEGAKKANEESFNSMQKELSELKLKALKTNVAIEAGLPADLADRLTGEDEETLKADAEKLASFVGSKKVAPSFKTEEVPTDPAEAGFREMAQLFERK